MPSQPSEPSPVMVLKSAESRMSLPFPPILPEEKEVEKVADFDLLMDYFTSIYLIKKSYPYSHPNGSSPEQEPSF